MISTVALGRRCVVSSVDRRTPAQWCVHSAQKHLIHGSIFQVPFCCLRPKPPREPDGPASSAEDEPDPASSFPPPCASDLFSSIPKWRVAEAIHLSLSPTLPDATSDAAVPPWPPVPAPLGQWLPVAVRSDGRHPGTCPQHPPFLLLRP